MRNCLLIMILVSLFLLSCKNKDTVDHVSTNLPSSHLNLIDSILYKKSINEIIELVSGKRGAEIPYTQYLLSQNDIDSDYNISYRYGNIFSKEHNHLLIVSMLRDVSYDIYVQRKDSFINVLHLSLSLVQARNVNHSIFDINGDDLSDMDII